jgi:hypothetical protein
LEDNPHQIALDGFAIEDKPRTANWQSSQRQSNVRQASQRQNWGWAVWGYRFKNEQEIASFDSAQDKSGVALQRVQGKPRKDDGGWGGNIYVGVQLSAFKQYQTQGYWHNLALTRRLMLTFASAAWI